MNARFFSSASRVVTSLALAALAVHSQGCALFSRYGRRAESTREAAGYRGTVTFVNQSGANVCRIEALHSRESNVDLSVNLSPGQSATFEARGDISRLAISECGSHRVLFGVPSRDARSTLSKLTMGRVVLYAQGQAPAGASDHHALEVAPLDYADWWSTELRWYTRNPDARMHDESLATEFLQTVRSHAQAQRWTEEFRAFQIVSADWEIIRHRATGAILRRRLMGVGMAKFPNSHCQSQAFFVTQEYDGSDYSPTLRFAGVSSNVAVPCALTEWFAEQPDVVH